MLQCRSDFGVTFCAHFFPPYIRESKTNLEKHAHFWPCCSSPSGLSQSVSGCPKTERNGRRFWCLSCLALGPRGKKSWVKPGLVPVHTVIQSTYFHLLAQSPVFNNIKIGTSFWSLISKITLSCSNKNLHCLSIQFLSLDLSVQVSPSHPSLEAKLSPNLRHAHHVTTGTHLMFHVEMCIEIGRIY